LTDPAAIERALWIAAGAALLGASLLAAASAVLVRAVAAAPRLAVLRSGLAVASLAAIFVAAGALFTTTAGALLHSEGVDLARPVRFVHPSLPLLLAPPLAGAFVFVAVALVLGARSRRAP
jgi:hypothetical protein